MSMESAQVVLAKIAAARSLAHSLAAQHPDGAAWSVLSGLLDGHEKSVRDHWPLTSAEKENVRLGWFSTRNIEEAYPQLHDLLSDASYSLRRSGEI